MSLTTQYVVPMNVLESIRDTCLFYPCSGGDLVIPIQLFSPFITDFWFVDKGYFSPGDQDTKYEKLDLPADKQAPLLKTDNNYRFIKSAIVGPVSWAPQNRDIEPCVLTETYEHIASGRQIRVHRRRGYGFSALRYEMQSIGVFFYRGDSYGEGGSGNLWLHQDHVYEICDKLIDGGLLVTDGSNRGAFTSKKHYDYHQFDGHRGLDVNTDPEKYIRSVAGFTDNRGNTFSCIGYAGQRYGPTMIWQVNKP